MKHLSFIVVGDEGSGKRSFVDRAALDLFNPYGHLFPGGKAKTYSYGNEEIIVFLNPNMKISKLAGLKRQILSSSLSIYQMPIGLSELNFILIGFHTLTLKSQLFYLSLKQMSAPVIILYSNR